MTLCGTMKCIEVHADGLTAETGAMLPSVARAAARHGLAGFAFLASIPGTVGGGVKMNAGAYGGDIASVLDRALVISAEGSGWRTPDDLGLEYRRSGLEPVAAHRAAARTHRVAQLAQPLE